MDMAPIFTKKSRIESVYVPDLGPTYIPTAVLGYRESERWIRIRIFCQDVLGYLVFFKLY